MKTVLIADNLRKQCDPASLKDLISKNKKPGPGIIGQPRATKAFELGLGMKLQGFNMYR